MSDRRRCPECKQTFSPSGGGHCRSCHRTFSSDRAYDKHRVGPMDARRCVGELESPWRITDRGWTPFEKLSKNPWSK